jgi:hypothetical protein
MASSNQSVESLIESLTKLIQGNYSIKLNLYEDDQVIEDLIELDESDKIALIAKYKNILIASKELEIKELKSSLLTSLTNFKADQAILLEEGMNLINIKYAITN